MSYMLVKGKIFVCEECFRGIQVEYEGGEKLTQIGQFSIDIQNRISKDIRKLFPEQSHSYLFELGICEECYHQNHFLKNPEEETYVAKYFQLCNALNDEKETIKDSMKHLIQKMTDDITNNMTIDYIEAISQQQFDPFLGDKHSTISKRKGKFKQWYQNHIRPNIKQFLINRAKENEHIKPLVFNFNLKVYELFMDILCHLKNNYFIALIPKDISKLENLNLYLMNETTVRCPVRDTPVRLFYHKGKLDIYEKMISFMIYTEDIESMIDTSLLEKQYKYILEPFYFNQRL